jgi:hypothetical protein
MPDRTGNTLLSAKQLTSLNATPLSVKDAVNQQDKNDLYRFRLSERSSLNLQLSGVQKGAKLLVELLMLKGNPDKVLRKIGKIEFSSLKASAIRNNLTSITRAIVPGRTNQSITALLNTGEYYLRIARVKNQSRYQLQMSSVADTPIAPTTGGSLPVGGSTEQTPPVVVNDSGSGGSTPGDSGGTNPPPPSLTTRVLYDGNGLPQNESWLAYGQLPFFGNQASQTAGATGVTLNTQVNSTDPTKGYAGYSNYTVNLATFTPQAVNSTFPTLDPTKGFTLSFRLSVNSEQSNPNRAGFSLILLGNNAQGIELGFKSNRIFAQSDTFTEAETVTPGFGLNSAVDYKLAIQGSSYQLFANSSSILNGSLRSYQFNPATSDPPLPFNPYTVQNFLFLGDNTDQGGANVTIGNISIAA